MERKVSPAVADEQAVAAWATSRGLRVTQRFPNRLVVDLEAPAGTIERALGVQINSYRVGDETHYSNDRDPVLPAALVPVVHSVLGLNSIEHDLPNGGAGRADPTCARRRARRSRRGDAGRIARLGGQRRSQD
jgi:hypothetical protein